MGRFEYREKGLEDGSKNMVLVSVIGLDSVSQKETQSHKLIIKAAIFVRATKQKGLSENG